MTEGQDPGTSDQAVMGRTEYRPLWVLNLSVVIRALHQVGAAVFLTSFLLNDVGEYPGLYVYLAVFSGVALLATEGMRHRQIYREVSGLVTLVKCLLLGVAVHGWLSPSATVLVAFLVASMGAHAPKNIRHRLVL